MHQAIDTSRKTAARQDLTCGASTLTLCLLLAATVACAPPAAEDPAPPPPAAPVELGADADAAQAVITPDVLRAPIEELSSDAYGGRGPGSDGDRMTQEWLVKEMTAIGFEPGMPDGSWEQPFDIVGVESKATPVWSFTAGDKTVDLAWHDDYVASSGVQEEKASLTDAELVFVGYGIQAPEYGWDDFQGTDVSGKVLVVMNNDPDWDPELFEGTRRLYYGRWSYKYEKAAELGAAGAIIIHTTPSAGYGFNVVQTSWTGPQFEVPAADEPRIQIPAWTTEDAMKRVLAAGGHDLDALRESARSPEFVPVPLGITTSIELTNTIQRVKTANIVGVLKGSDPKLADEYVVYSAHHDHLGISSDESAEDRIYNGALDNAAGVSQVLAMGRAFAALPERPRRSIMIAMVAAEEQGLLGSSYFAKNPPVAAGQFAANINYDGANIWGMNRDVTFIGKGKSTLDGVVEKFAGEQGRTVKPDQFPDRGFFYRSDQFNFAKIGVPAIYLDTGTDFVDQEAEWGREQIEAWEAVHYHQPSDELVDTWVWEGIVADSVLGFRCGLYIANQDAMPTWTPGDEFEAARQAALAARP